MKDYDIHVNIKTGRKLNTKERNLLTNALHHNTDVCVREVRSGEAYAIVLGNLFEHSGDGEEAKMLFDQFVGEVRKLYPGAYVDMYWTEIPESEFVFNTNDEA
jgi:hypothetical protein